MRYFTVMLGSNERYGGCIAALIHYYPELEIITEMPPELSQYRIENNRLNADVLRYWIMANSTEDIVYFDADIIPLARYDFARHSNVAAWPVLDKYDNCLIYCPADKTQEMQAIVSVYRDGLNIPWSLQYLRKIDGIEKIDTSYFIHVRMTQSRRT